MKSFIFIINFTVLIFTTNLFAQTDTLFLNDLSLVFENGKMIVSSESGTESIKQFKNPTGYVVDLDDDGLDELLVNDSEIKNGKTYYTFFLFTDIDSLVLADSVYSGLTEPYVTFLEETKSNVIISGSPDFDSLNTSQNENIYTPMITWQFSENGLYMANDQIYDIFKIENEKIISSIDSFLKKNGKNCESTKKMEAAIATVYLNYIYANENTTADNFLNKYYLCNDKEKFEKFLIEHQ